MLLPISFSDSYAADSQKAVLMKGLNVAGWLANARRQPIYARDFIQIKKAGFDHIRLPVTPEFFGITLEPDSVKNAKLSEVDKGIALALAYNLPVVLDIHPGKAFMNKLETSDEAEREFIHMWSELAKRYSKYPSEKLIFELLNEPQYYHREERYNALVKRTVDAIRKVYPARTLVVDAPNGSSIEGLQKLDVLHDKNIIYAFHFYYPYIITHQGVHMGFEGTMVRSFRNLPYPSDKAIKSAAFYAPAAPNPAQAQLELDAYKNAHWNYAAIKEQIAMADKWSKEKNVHIICGEFGVLRNHIDADSRYNWIGDTRKALEEFGIGWQYWEYTDLMGIVTMIGATNTDPVDGSVRFNNPLKGSRQFEPLALSALGLSAQ